MTGGRRVVRVRGANNGHTSVFEAVLDRPVGDALIVAEGGDLNKSSSLRKLFTEADNAAAIACYPDSPRDIADVVRNALKAEGLSIGAEALDDAVSRLGSDRGVTRRELDKLILYARGQKKIELADIRAIMGDDRTRAVHGNERERDARVALSLPGVKAPVSGAATGARRRHRSEPPTLDLWRHGRHTLR